MSKFLNKKDDGKLLDIVIFAVNLGIIIGIPLLIIYDGFNF